MFPYPLSKSAAASMHLCFRYPVYLRYNTFFFLNAVLIHQSVMHKIITYLIANTLHF